ncbi:hypothetical protein [Methylosinus sp. PW1]|uniref:hypothetical protein n=1 Tax=Methylosinus sp. PW1 TaxID=107636 RepID=UPI0012EB4A09|nr:hypothetical protein [Methylosinus sp. PW1]
MFGIPRDSDISKTEAARHALRKAPRPEIEELVRIAMRWHMAASRLIYIESECSLVVHRATDACIAAAGAGRTPEEIVAIIEDAFAAEVDRRIKGLKNEIK